MTADKARRLADTLLTAAARADEQPGVIVTARSPRPAVGFYPTLEPETGLPERSRDRQWASPRTGR